MLSNIFNLRRVSRTPEEQAIVDAATAKLTLYHFESCPYCRKVRDRIDKLSLNIERRDIRTEPQNGEDLFEATGRYTVPVLRIEQEDGTFEWMRESSDIVAWLSEQYG